MKLWSSFLLASWLKNIGGGSGGGGGGGGGGGVAAAYIVDLIESR